MSVRNFPHGRSACQIPWTSHSVSKTFKNGVNFRHDFVALRGKTCYNHSKESGLESRMKRCFIFAAGTFFGLRQRPESGDLVIAADAGYLTCKKEQIVPTLLLGDFDSMEQPMHFKHSVRVPVEKDDTDTMLAVKTALNEHCDTIYIYGGTGGTRLDHTLANLQTLWYIRRHGAKGYLYDEDFVWTVIENETLTIEKTMEWGLVSVFCLGNEAEGVSESGLQYTLCDAVLTGDFPLGISNHMKEPTASISVRQGALAVGWQLSTLSKR